MELLVNGPISIDVRQSMFIAMLELAKPISGELLKASVTLVLAFSLSTTFREVKFNAILFPLVSSCSFERLI